MRSQWSPLVWKWHFWTRYPVKSCGVSGPKRPNGCANWASTPSATLPVGRQPNWRRALANMAAIWPIMPKGLISARSSRSVNRSRSARRPPLRAMCAMANSCAASCTNRSTVSPASYAANGSPRRPSNSSCAGPILPPSPGRPVLPTPPQRRARSKVPRCASLLPSGTASSCG